MARRRNRGAKLRALADALSRDGDVRLAARQAGIPLAQARVMFDEICQQLGAQAR